MLNKVSHIYREKNMFVQSFKKFISIFFMINDVIEGMVKS